MALLEKQELVNYLITKHKEKFNSSRITPIKLQKGLYFLYAFWGGKIKGQQLCDSSDEAMTEANFEYEEDLFDASFEAWTYGPVDRSIYIWYKNLSDEDYNNINCHNLKISDEFVVGYIDNLINKIFNTNDFVLVDLSHEDKCWSDVYDSGCKKPMNNDAIKREYA